MKNVWKYIVRYLKQSGRRSERGYILKNVIEVNQSIEISASNVLQQSQPQIQKQPAPSSIKEEKESSNKSQSKPSKPPTPNAQEDISQSGDVSEVSNITGNTGNEGKPKKKKKVKK